MEAKEGANVIYTVQYQAGPYNGTRPVEADDSEIAIQIVRARIRKEMTLPMYSESYRVVDTRNPGH
jgi:hypothetical protein